MHLSRVVSDEINAAVGFLVEVSLSMDQNFAIMRQLGEGYTDVTFQGAQHLSAVLGTRRYSEDYDHLTRERAYTVKMLDGGLLHLMYRFAGAELERHRLAFFPAPHLEDFQNSPERYLEDEIYAEIVGREVVPIPLRFDFDCRSGVHSERDHPKSHMTLGQYQDCRIPVSAPLPPLVFVDFVLRNFYHTSSLRFADDLPRRNAHFGDSILPAEEGLVHLRIPGVHGASRAQAPSEPRAGTRPRRAGGRGRR